VAAGAWWSSLGLEPTHDVDHTVVVRGDWGVDFGSCEAADRGEWVFLLT
jgi:hypothetical protein